MRRWWFPLGLLAVGCGADGERVEARRFLALYEALDHRDTILVRETKLRDLSALPLNHPEVREARDLCLAAHRTLIQAERVQEAAAQALDEAIRHSPNGEPLPAQKSEQIAGDIRQAEATLGNARTQFVPCENAARSLALRFGERR